MIEKLLFNKRSVNHSGKYETLLLAATRYRNSPEVIEMLLKHGAGVKASDARLLEPADYAVVYGDITALKMLMEAGAEIDAGTLGTALKFNRSAEGVKFLVSAGVQFEKDDEPSVLMAAACYSELDMIKFLIENGMDINSQDFQGKTAIENASENPDVFEVISFFKAAGVEPGTISGETFPPFVLVSALNTRPRQIEKFIDNGADFTEKSSTGLNVFAAACRFNRNPAVIEVFLKHGFNITDSDDNGKTYYDYIKLNPSAKMREAFAQ